VIACNRAIELIAADYWVWVDRFHYERSKWHPNAKTAIEVHPDTSRIVQVLPCADGEFLLHGGTLTVAAHFALKQGAQKLVFVQDWGEAV
jgi:hypothetical protein